MRGVWKHSMTGAIGVLSGGDASPVSPARMAVVRLSGAEDVGSSLQLVPGQGSRFESSSDAQQTSGSSIASPHATKDQSTGSVNLRPSVS